MRNSGIPWYISLIGTALIALAGRSVESYAEIPLYLLGHPEGQAFAAKERFSDENLARIEPHTSVREETSRAKVWAHLIGVLNKNGQA